jgi:hypothetical protein
MGTAARGRELSWEVAPVNSENGIEKAAAAREARDAVGSAQRRTGSRTGDIAAAMMRYLSSEQYRERAAAQDTDDEQRDPDASS